MAAILTRNTRTPRRHLLFPGNDVTFRRLLRARDFLAAGFARSVTLDRAAREACLSPFHFQRQLAQAFCETPHQFVTRLRMDAAKTVADFR